MLGLCEVMVRLLGDGGNGRGPLRGLMTEEAAIAELYFGHGGGRGGGGGSERIDPGLVERLLWWEGIDAGQVQASGGVVPRIRTTRGRAPAPRAA